MNIHIKHTKVKLVDLTGGARDDIYQKIFTLGIIPFFQQNYSRFQILSLTDPDSESASKLATLPDLETLEIPQHGNWKIDTPADDENVAFLKSLSELFKSAEANLEYKPNAIDVFVKKIFAFEGDTGAFFRINNLLRDNLSKIRISNIGLPKKEILEAFTTGLKDNTDYQRYKRMFIESVIEYLTNRLIFFLGKNKPIKIKDGTVISYFQASKSDPDYEVPPKFEPKRGTCPGCGSLNERFYICTLLLDLLMKTSRKEDYNKHKLRLEKKLKDIKDYQFKMNVQWTGNTGTSIKEIFILKMNKSRPSSSPPPSPPSLPLSPPKSPKKMRNAAKIVATLLGLNKGKKGKKVEKEEEQRIQEQRLQEQRLQKQRDLEQQRLQKQREQKQRDLEQQRLQKQRDLKDEEISKAFDEKIRQANRESPKKEEEWTKLKGVLEKEEEKERKQVEKRYLDEFKAYLITKARESPEKKILIQEIIKHWKTLLG